MGPNMSNIRQGLSGFGTVNAAVAAGGAQWPSVPAGTLPSSTACGYSIQCTEEYNGSSWSTGGSMGGCERGFYSAGGNSAYAGFVVGGSQRPTAQFQFGCSLDSTAEYNGTSWSSGGNMINQRSSAAGGGSVNAGIIFSSWPTSPSTQCATEEYNGSSWSSGPNEYSNGGGAGGGCQDDFIYLGGYAYIGSKTYNGISWSNSPGILNTFQNGGGDANGGSGCILAGGGISTGPSNIGSRLCFNALEGGPFNVFRSTYAKNIQQKYLGVVGGKCCAIAFGGTVPSSVSPTNPVVCTEIFTG